MTKLKDTVESTAGVHTMRRGATIQLTNTLKPICFQMPRCEKIWCNTSYCTLQRIGYIITSSPTATTLVSRDLKDEHKENRRHTYRDGHVRELALLQRRADLGHEVAQQDSEDHGE